MTKPTAILVGACGEHFVAAWLSAHGFIVAMPRAGVPGCDMFVSHERGGKTVRVQVKTGTQATKTTKAEGRIYLWSTSYGALKRNHHDLWYAYVWLNNWPYEAREPELFFVPARRVMRYLRSAQRAKDKWPYFWMKGAEAEKYRGTAGLKAVIRNLRG